MHIAADRISRCISVPFLHLADATALEIKDRKLSTIGLLGTKYTLDLPFYKDRLLNHGISVIVPEEPDKELINSVIYDELVHAEVKDSSRQHFLDIIQKLTEQGAEGVILGCTEITLLVKQSMTDTPLFDTTQIHVQKALDAAFEN